MKTTPVDVYVRGIIISNVIKINFVFIIKLNNS